MALAKNQIYPNPYSSFTTFAPFAFDDINATTINAIEENNIKYNPVSFVGQIPR